MKQVLIVDDDPDILSSLRFSLEDRYPVETAVNGADALRKLLRAPASFGAVILDLMMPVMSGEAFIRELASRKLEVPVIIVSAGVDLDARAAALGATDYVRKPFDLEELEVKIRRIFGGTGAPA